jgi:AcrR family transcriptional regulator
MTCTVKDPETRRGELIDAAEELFLASGYEDTAVSDIVRKIGVAQGTF